MLCSWHVAAKLLPRNMTDFPPGVATVMSGAWKGGGLADDTNTALQSG